MRLCSRARSLRFVGRVPFVAFWLAASVDPLTAQCANLWLPSSGGLPGVDGRVCASMLWDPDGAGPRPPALVLGGDFTVAGGQRCPHVALYDLQRGEWSPLGTGMNHAVWALTTAPNGDLIAGGQFTMAGGIPAPYVARFDGTTWSGLGSGVNQIVFALTVFGGDVVAAGRFTSAGGAPANRVASWNGTSWSALGTGMNEDVLALATYAGDLVAGGGFTIAGGGSHNHIASWNGAAWSGLGSGVNSTVSALTVANGVLVAGGLFSVAGGTTAHRVAQWNGSTWSPMGQGFNHASSVVYALATLPSGEVVAGGVCVTPTEWRALMRWNGTGWFNVDRTLSVPIDYVRTVTALGQDVIAGGVFPSMGLSTVNNVVQLSTVTPDWAALSSGLFGGTGVVPAGVKALTTLPDGATVAAGRFSYSGAQRVNNIAWRNGARWMPMGTGLDDAVFALAKLGNGDVVAGGYFINAGSLPAPHIARWDGSAWSAFGGGMDNHVFALLTLSDGRLVAGGRFSTAGGVAANRIAVWSGVWSPLGAGMNDRVFALAETPAGLVAGGRFTTAGGVPASRIAIWRAGAWAALGAGFDGDVFALGVLPNGDVIAAGAFTLAGSATVNHIARWDGNGWVSLGGGLAGGDAHALHVLANGDVIAVGGFRTAGGGNADRIARWDGTRWSAVGAGMDGVGRALMPRADGSLEVGGDFYAAGGQPTSYVATASTTCPAAVTTLGVGCAGSGGLSTYTASTLPWVGGLFRARGTNLPAQALVAVVSGLSTVSVPLASLLPPSPPGCSLLVSPFIVELAHASAGIVDTQLPIPNQATLADLVLHRQLVVLELQVENTSTNGLSLRVGVF